jgi:nickel transport protein
VRSWSVPSGVLLGLAVILVTAAGVSAHDIWITLVQEKPDAVRAVVNYGHPGDRPAPIADKLFELSIRGVNPTWQSLLTEVKSDVQDGIPVLMTEPVPIAKDARVLVLAARYDNGYWVKTPYGYRNTSKRQVPDTERSISSMKFAKALVQLEAGPSNDFQTVIGHRLELVPLTDPFALKPRDTMKVRVYFEGKPLVDAGVEIGDGVTPRAEEDIPRYKTDASGLAEVPIAQPGLQLLVVEHTTPAIHPNLCDQDVAIATLSFVLTPRR